MKVCLTFYDDTEEQQRLADLYEWRKDMYFDTEQKRIILEHDQIHVMRKKESLEELEERPLHKYVALVNPGDRQLLEKVLNAGVSHVIAGTHSIPKLAHHIKNRTSSSAYIDPKLNMDFLKVIDKVFTRKTKTGAQSDLKLDVVKASLTLSSAECCVLQGILDGCSNLKIADNTYLANSTVNNHVSKIIKKIHAKDRTHTVKRAIELGWIKGPSSHELGSLAGLQRMVH